MNSMAETPRSDASSAASEAMIPSCRPITLIALVSVNVKWPAGITAWCSCQACRMIAAAAKGTLAVSRRRWFCSDGAVLEKARQNAAPTYKKRIVI